MCILSLFINWLIYLLYRIIINPIFNDIKANTSYIAPNNRALSIQLSALRLFILSCKHHTYYYQPHITVRQDPHCTKETIPTRAQTQELEEKSIT